MSDEKYVIGAYYRENGVAFRFFVQGDYYEDYARDLAINLRMIKNGKYDQEKAQFLARFMSLTIDDAGTTARLYPVNPHSDHTLHFVNIDKGTVELWNNSGTEKKVDFFIDKFIERYYK